jgi:hypothetical protein
MVRRKDFPILSRASGGAMADWSFGLLLGHLEKAEGKQTCGMLQPGL